MGSDIGTVAPDFTLPDVDQRAVTLSEEVKRGPVILAFFPAAFSPTCTREMCTFRDSPGALSRITSRIFGISADSFFTLKAWAEIERITFPLLSDFNRDVIRAYGIDHEMVGLQGVAKRATFIVDRQQIVRYSQVLESAKQEPDYERLAAVWVELQALPQSW